MTDGLDSIIKQLERQKTAIERALVALKGVDGTEAPATPEATPRKRRGLTAAARRTIALAQKARWAKVRGESAPSASEPPKTERKLSAAVRKAIQESMRRRWALKRAAAKKTAAA